MCKVGFCAVPLHHVSVALSPEIILETTAKISSGRNKATNPKPNMECNFWIQLH